MTARPYPPASMFEFEGKPFEPAHDVERWATDQIIDEGGQLYNEEHDHLRFARIGFLWTVVENASKGRRVLGQCEFRPPNVMGKWARARASYQLSAWFGGDLDFLITLDASYCSICSDAEFCALVEHELYHCGQDHDEFGAPKFAKGSGLPTFCIRGHDIEEFTGIVRRYGVEAAQAQAFIDAASRPPEISPARIAQSCGTCQLRVA